MNAATLNCIKAVLQADESMTPNERLRILGALKNGEQPLAKDPPRIIRRAEAAKRLSCSLRLIDKLSATRVLQRHVLPGRQRAVGFLESDVVALVNGRGQ